MASILTCVRTLFALSLTATLLQPADSAAQRSGQTQPNIILILADDLGIGDVPSSNPASQLTTPSLARMANEGIQFTQAYSSAANCAPTRYNLLSGNYAWRGEREFGKFTYYGDGSQFTPDDLTLADVLESGGYHTGFIGKHHLGGNMYLLDSNEFAVWNDNDTDIDFSRGFFDGPLAHGFAESFVSLMGVSSPPYAFFRNDMLDGDPMDLIVWDIGTYGNSVIQVQGVGFPEWDTSQLDTTLLDESLQFIRTASRPFFLYMPLTSPHSPWTPPDTLYGTPIRGQSGITARTDMVLLIDVVVREVLEELTTQGLERDTIVIFTSDNGGVQLSIELDAGHDSSGGLRDDKRSIYEGGYRVPLLVRWGDGTVAGSTIAPGTVAGEVVGLTDFYTTLAEIASVSIPANQARDSSSMAPIFFDRSDRDRRARSHTINVAKENEAGVVMSEYRMLAYAYREVDWKLILRTTTRKQYASKATALFDLATDPAETNNLIDQPGLSALVSALQSRFDEWRLSQRSTPTFVQAVTGAPVYEPGTDVGFFLWQDEDSGAWRLRWSGDGAPHRFMVSVTEVGGGMTGVRSSGYFGRSDRLIQVPDGFTVDAATGAWEAGVDFFASPGALLVIEASIDGDADPALLKIGNAGTNPQELPTYIAANPILNFERENLFGAPSYVPGGSVGYYLWQSATDGRWNLRWNSDAGSHQFNGSILANLPVTDVQPIALKPGDSYHAEEFSLQFSGQATAADAGLSFRVPAGGTLVVRVRIDGLPTSVLLGPSAVAASADTFSVGTGSPPVKQWRKFTKIKQ